MLNFVWEKWLRSYYFLFFLKFLHSNIFALCKFFLKFLFSPLVIYYATLTITLTLRFGVMQLFWFTRI